MRTDPTRYLSVTEASRITLRAQAGELDLTDADGDIVRLVEEARVISRGTNTGGMARTAEAVHGRRVLVVGGLACLIGAFCFSATALLAV